MNKGIVSLVKRGENKLHITLELVVTPATGVSLKSVMDLSSQTTCINYLNLSHTAVEAAYLSGVLFGLRKIYGIQTHDFGCEVTILHVSGILPGNIDEGLTPCSMATFVGLAYLTGHPEVISEGDLEGWELAKFEHGSG